MVSQHIKISNLTNNQRNREMPNVTNSKLIFKYEFLFCVYHTYKDNKNTHND